MALAMHASSSRSLTFLFLHATHSIEEREKKEHIYGHECVCEE